MGATERRQSERAGESSQAKYYFKSPTGCTGAFRAAPAFLPSAIETRERATPSAFLFSAKDA